MDEALASAIRSAFEAESGIAAVWLFGSRARGEAGRNSDVDIAVLFDSAADLSGAWGGRPVQLGSALEARLALPVDLVAMNGAPADLVRQVLRHGALLVERDASARIAFEVYKRNEWFDLDMQRRSARAAQ